MSPITKTDTTGSEDSGLTVWASRQAAAGRLESEIYEEAESNETSAVRRYHLLVAASSVQEAIDGKTCDEGTLYSILDTLSKHPGSAGAGSSLSVGTTESARPVGPSWDSPTSRAKRLASFMRSKKD